MLVSKEKESGLRIDSKERTKSKQLSGDITPKRIPHPNANDKDSL